VGKTKQNKKDIEMAIQAGQEKFEIQKAFPETGRIDGR